MPINKLGISIPLFERGAGGIATTTDAGLNLADRAEGVQGSCAAFGGYESLRTGFACGRDEALEILYNWLGRSTVATGPDGQTIFEGQLAEITAKFGQRTRGVSLARMANRVQVHYTDSNGVKAQTATASDTASSDLYGIKYLVESARATTATAATGIRDRLLAKYKNPVKPSSTRISTGNQGDISVELQFKGWFWTFDWVQLNNSSETVTAIDTQLVSLLTSYNAINNFFSVSTTDIGSPGRSDTEYAASGGTYLNKIKTLVSQGDGSDRWVLMCLDNKAFTYKKWAAATPDTVHYVADFGDHQVYTPEGAAVAPWDVRPDKMYRDIGLLALDPISSAYDDGTRDYVERVTWWVNKESVGVTLEPASSDSLDALLASLG